MSITVRDCLKLPSLRNAEVLAGHAGLDQYVSTVSVLEYAKTFAMANPLFLGNEIILTAFISIKDDVDAQCEAIRRLHAVGEAAIVLYYVDYYMENVDQKLISVANELDFPLIVMPRNDYSLRYSDVITEVLMHIFRDQQNETRFATQLLQQIMVVEPVHGGLECGAFFEKNPDLDMIAIGPSLTDVHSPDESCDIESIRVTAELVIRILEKLA